MNVMCVVLEKMFRFYDNTMGEVEEKVVSQPLCIHDFNARVEIVNTQCFEILLFLQCTVCSQSQFIHIAQDSIS